VKAAGNDWEVSGYLSTYDNIDLGGDVVRPGAFDRWLASGEKTRFLWSHDVKLPLGPALELKSDKKGLLARAKMSKTSLGQDVHTWVMDGAVDSWSIGYIAREANPQGDLRELLDMDLPEGSLVSIPMNPKAIVTGAKGYTGETIADRAANLKLLIEDLLSDTRAVAEAGPGPLNQTKRLELEALLETLSGLNDAHSQVAQILKAAPVSQVASKRLHYELAERRKRHASLLMES
jgi:HK97 family phage prohead protease